ncbi:MAG TPA: mannonate dehydratase [Fimbriimonadaceae bacterium]|jgi:mannonate dehydratase
MNQSYPSQSLLEESFRWFGPGDPVSLAFIRQAGAEAIFTSMHEIPYGEAWPREAIAKRRQLIEAAGLRWTAVESLPVHEEIKTGLGDLGPLFSNYSTSLENLAAEGVTTVIYNFMPVLDWVRTDLRHVLPDGSECLRFDPVHFAAFDLFAIKRAGAEYCPEIRERAAAWWSCLDCAAQQAFVQTIVDVFPGVKLGLTLPDVREMLSRYSGIDEDGLRANFARFLEAIVPVAERVGIHLAVHPDDPPFPLLGLPRIVSTKSDMETILGMVESPANGLCFCTGSLSARPDNDVTAMARQFAPRINAVHLRSTAHLPDGGFYEADHLAGSVDMASAVEILLNEQDRRGSGIRIPFRPDHGHTMMDDLEKPPFPNPGYSGIGRMRGLAELRGLMVGLRHRQVSR